MPVLLLAAVAFAAPDVFTVSDPANPAALQAAIDAASDGDVIRVEAGVYSPCHVDRKSLVIHVVDPAGAIGRIEVTNLAADQSFTLTGAASPTPQLNSVSLLIDGCAGPVYVSGLALDKIHFEGGTPTLEVFDSNAVVLHELMVGAGWDCFYAGPCAGVLAASVTRSKAAMSACTIEGRDGLNNGPGGTALDCLDSDLFLQGCRLVGGDGDGGFGCDDWLTSDAGGSGLLAGGASHVAIIDSHFEAGISGNGFLAKFCPDSEGRNLCIVPGSSVEFQSRFEVELHMPSTTPDAVDVPIEVEGTPGHALLMLVGSSQSFAALPGVEGALLLTGRGVDTGRFLIGPSPATWSWTAPDLAAGASSTYWFQPLQLRPGKMVFGHAEPLTVFGR
ncbi:MAG: hypothetical protein AAF726_22430 [Planctomycetota bacterium]